LAHPVDERQTLELMELRSPGDTGAYKCTARNAVGSSQDIATVFVQPDDTPLPANQRTLLVFNRRRAQYARGEMGNHTSTAQWRRTLKRRTMTGGIFPDEM